MKEFTLPALGPGSGNSLALTSNLSAAFVNPVVPALPAGSMNPSNGKVMLTLSGGGATWTQFNTVFYAVGPNPVASTTCPGLVAGGVYLIEGFQPGDKLALFSYNTSCVATMVRIA